MSTLDDTWRAEASELGCTVTPGWPEWAGEHTSGLPLPAPENARLCREAIQTLWPDGLVPTDEMIADFPYDTEDH